MMKMSSKMKIDGIICEGLICIFSLHIQENKMGI